jgi:hypothetical protein
MKSRTSTRRKGHKEVIMQHGSVREGIDEKIAPLVLATWRAGVRTNYSCQDERGPDDRDAWAVLGFSSVADARKWMRIVAKYEKDGRWLHNQEMCLACREMGGLEWRAGAGKPTRTTPCTRP